MDVAISSFSAVTLVYFDSSAFVKLLVEEDGSDLADALWDGVRLRVAAIADRMQNELLVQPSVDTASGSDSKYEDDNSAVAYVVDDAVCADADAPPAGRTGQRHRTGRPRLGAEGCDRLDDPPADGRVKLADLLTG